MWRRRKNSGTCCQLDLANKHIGLNTSENENTSSDWLAKWTRFLKFVLTRKHSSYWFWSGSTQGISANVLQFKPPAIWMLNTFPSCLQYESSRSCFCLSNNWAKNVVPGEMLFASARGRSFNSSSLSPMCWEFRSNLDNEESINYFNPYVECSSSLFFSSEAKEKQLDFGRQPFNAMLAKVVSDVYKLQSLVVFANWSGHQRSDLIAKPIEIKKPALAALLPSSIDEHRRLWTPIYGHGVVKCVSYCMLERSGSSEPTPFRYLVLPEDTIKYTKWLFLV